MYICHISESSFYDSPIFYNMGKGINIWKIRFVYLKNIKFDFNQDSKKYARSLSSLFKIRIFLLILNYRISEHKVGTGTCKFF